MKERLSLYVRHRAWLTASPNIKGGKRQSRIQTILDNRGEDWEIAMPPVGNELYIVALLDEVGPVVSNGMGISPVSWTEIRDWKEMLQLELEPWELSLIRQLSSEHATEYSLASDSTRPAPYIPSAETIDRAALSNNLGSALRGFKKGQKNKE